jgi:hypothetical protein
MSPSERALAVERLLRSGWHVVISDVAPGLVTLDASRQLPNGASHRISVTGSRDGAIKDMERLCKAMSP